MTDQEIIQAMALSGVEVSRSRVNGWKRGAGALKRPDPGSHNPDNRERRMKLMSDEEFDAFCRGLWLWLRDRGD